MKCSRWYPVGLLFGFWGSLHAENSVLNSFDKMKKQSESRYGLVHIKDTGKFREIHHLYIDSRSVAALDKDDGYFILSKYQFGNVDALLIGGFCGGNSCPLVHFKFLVIYPDKSTKLVGGDNFSSEFGQIREVSVSPENILLDLGYENKKSKRARFDGKTLSISIDQALEARSISAGACTQTFKDAYSACKDIKSCYGRDASGLISLVSQAEWRTLEFTANDPGFNVDHFVTMCNNACSTKKLADFKTFERQVCSYDGSSPAKSTALVLPAQSDLNEQRATTEVARPSRPPQHPKVDDGEVDFGPWHVSCKVDQMLGEKMCYAMQMTAGGIVVGASDRGNWILRVPGGDKVYPGTPQLIRIDSRELFIGNGRFKELKRIVEQMKTGNTLRTRWYGWPDKYEVNGTFSLSGFNDSLKYFDTYFRTAK